MENGGNAKTGAQNSHIEVPAGGLRFCTYEARDIIREANLQGLSTFWQVVLMTWCFNFTPSRVLANIRGIRKSNPMDSADEIIQKVREDRLGKAQHQATFTDRAIKNLWLVDRFVLAADYRTRLDELANVLDKVDGDMIRDLAEDGRTHMGLLLVKLQELVARKLDALDSMRKFVPYEPEKVIPMSQETQEYLEGIIKEMRMIRKKEEDNGPK